MARDSRTPPVLALTEAQRQLAMERFAVLQPHLEEDVPLARAARQAGVPVRTAERWLARYRQQGLAGLARPVRRDTAVHRLPADLVALMEGMGLKKPRASASAIHRRVSAVATAQGWHIPSYSTVYAILAALDPAMVTLAHEGAAAFRDRYELIHRHRAAAPNAIWQADHTLLDLLILDEAGKPARPWLTTVVDDHSRAVAGTMVFLGAPSTLQTSLALRQAIWRKADPSWPVCGIPDVLYVDHGSDFTSHHLEQVAASLRFRIVYSAVARPQGRGKIERLFGTLNTELLPELPGHLRHGQPVTMPRLSLAQQPIPQCHALFVQCALRHAVVLALRDDAGHRHPAVGSFEVRDHLLGKQAHRRGHVLVRQAAQIHVAQEMGHVPGLQVLDGGRDLRRRANGPHSFLPTGTTITSGKR